MAAHEHRSGRTILTGEQGTSQNVGFCTNSPVGPGEGESQMSPKRLVIGGVILGRLLGVSAFRQTRDSRTPPPQPPQDKAQQAENAQTPTLSDATSSEQERGRPHEPTETATPPQGRGSDQPQQGGAIGETLQEPKPPMEPSQPPPQEPKPSKPQETGTLSVNAQPWA